MVSPKKWGNDYWSFLHILSKKYPINPSKTDITMIKKIIYGLSYVLPCKTCSKHLIKNMEKNKLSSKDISSNKYLINWFIDLHNIVNIMLKKNNFNNDNFQLIYDINQYNFYLKKILHHIEIVCKMSNPTEINKILEFVQACLYYSDLNLTNFVYFNNYKTYKQSIDIIYKFL